MRIGIAKTGLACFVVLCGSLAEKKDAGTIGFFLAVVPIAFAVTGIPTPVFQGVARARFTAFDLFDGIAVLRDAFVAIWHVISGADAGIFLIAPFEMSLDIAHAFRFVGIGAQALAFVASEFDASQVVAVLGIADITYWAFGSLAQEIEADHNLICL